MMTVKKAKRELVTTIVKKGVAALLLLIAGIMVLRISKDGISWLRYVALVGFAGATFFLYGFGCAVYDYWQLKKDAEEESTSKKAVPAPKEEPTHDEENAEKPKRLTRKALKEESDAADDELVEAELSFQHAEERADEAKAQLDKYEELLARARARRAAKKS